MGATRTPMPLVCCVNRAAHKDRLAAQLGQCARQGLPVEHVGDHCARIDRPGCGQLQCLRDVGACAVSPEAKGDAGEIHLEQRELTRAEMIARALADALRHKRQTRGAQVPHPSGRLDSEVETVRHGFDLAVEATGRVRDLGTACLSLVPEGVCESAGNHFRPGELPLFEMYLSGVTLRLGRDSARAHIPQALQLAATGAVNPRAVVSDVLDWETLPSALPELRSKPVFVRSPVDAAD